MYRFIDISIELHLRLIRREGLLLHNLQYTFARIGTVLRIAIDRNGLLEGANILLAMHIDTGPALLCYGPYGTSLTANYRPNHLTLDQNA